MGLKIRFFFLCIIYYVYVPCTYGKLFICLFRPFTTEQVDYSIMMSPFHNHNTCSCIFRLNPKELLNHAYLCGVSIPVYKKLIVCVCVLCAHVGLYSLQTYVKIVHVLLLGGDYGY